MKLETDIDVFKSTICLLTHKNCPLLWYSINVYLLWIDLTAIIILCINKESSWEINI